MGGKKKTPEKLHPYSSYILPNPTLFPPQENSTPAPHIYSQILHSSLHRKTLPLFLIYTPKSYILSSAGKIPSTEKLHLPPPFVEEII